MFSLGKTMDGVVLIWRVAFLSCGDVHFFLRIFKQSHPDGRRVDLCCDREILKTGHQLQLVSALFADLQTPTKEHVWPVRPAGIWSPHLFRRLQRHQLGFLGDPVPEEQQAEGMCPCPKPSKSSVSFGGKHMLNCRRRWVFGSIPYLEPVNCVFNATFQWKSRRQRAKRKKPSKKKA